MRPSLLITTAALLWPVAVPVQAASFDCAKAATWIEEAICADLGLSALDSRMSSGYQDARKTIKTTNPELYARIGRDQAAWLKRRDQCSNTTCLHRLYDQRIVELAGYGAGGPGSRAPRGRPIEYTQGTISDSGPHHSLIAVYPVLPGKGPAIDSANREIRAFPKGYADEFMKELQNLSSEGDEGFEGPGWSLDIDYREPYATGRYTAILFGGYDYRGGAHGMPIIEPLVIETASGKAVPPEGLFRAGSDWLETLALHSRAELARRDLLSQDADWLNSGTEAKAENYRLLYPGPDGLAVTFPPYAVAPYAAGPQEVLIPYSELSGILSPALFGP